MGINGNALALRRLFLPLRRPALVVLLCVVAVCCGPAREPCHVYKPVAADILIAAGDDGCFSAQSAASRRAQRAAEKKKKKFHVRARGTSLKKAHSPQIKRFATVPITLVRAGGGAHVGVHAHAGPCHAKG